MRAISFLFLLRAEKPLLCKLHYLNPTAIKTLEISARLSTIRYSPTENFPVYLAVE